MRFLVRLLMLAVSSPLFSQSRDDKWQSPTDIATSPQLLAPNPAGGGTQKLAIAAYQAARNRASGAIANPDNNRTEIDYRYAEEDKGVAFRYPFGGLAIGANGMFSSGDLVTKTDQRNNDKTEVLRQKNGELQAAIDLGSGFDAAFTYRYHYIERDILGGFNVANNDRTLYKGALTGYKMGVIYRDPAYILGVYNAPPMRGKVEVEGEQKIITESGVVALQAVLLGDSVIFGLSAQRYYYKLDERRKPSTSVRDQRQIMLSGLDLDPFYFRTERYGVGMQAPVFRLLKLALSVSQSQGYWLFNPEGEPSGGDSQQTPMRSQSLRLGFQYYSEQMSFEIGLEREMQQAKSLRDSRSLLGFGTYTDYKSQSDTAFIAISVFP